MGTFNVRNYEERIKVLTERAKAGNEYTNDADIGEQAYLESLLNYVRSWRDHIISKEELIRYQKTLRLKLEKYYQQAEIFELHINIQNSYSDLLTQAEKHGCPICKKLVRIFDGRENAMTA